MATHRHVTEQLLATAFAVSVCVLATPSLSRADEAWLTYQPAPCDNPYTGLVPYRRPADGRFPYAMEFDYLPLSALMTGPNSFDWTKLDEILEDVASRGRHSVFRIYLEYPDKLDAIPQFLIDAGLKTTRWTNTNTAPFPPKDCITPDYSDPQLVQALESFIAALGERYDDDPRVAYITAGLLGTWGEWHTYPRNDLWAPKETQRAVMDAFADAFDRVPVLLRYPTSGEHLYASTADRPFGYHDDSFAWATHTTGKPEHDWYFQTRLTAAGLADIWKSQPIGGEIRPEVWGCVFDEPSCAPQGQSFAACRDALHVSWLLDTGMSREQASPERAKRATDQVSRMGYQFHVDSVDVELMDDQTLSVAAQIENTGIAPFYHRGWHPRFGLHRLSSEAKTSNAVEPTKSFPQTRYELAGIQPGDHVTWHASLPVNELRTGRYAVCLTVPSNLPKGQPVRFANAGRGQHIDGWLSLATIDIP